MRSVLRFGLPAGTRYIRFLLLLTFSIFALVSEGSADAIQTVAIGVPSTVFLAGQTGNAQSCATIVCGFGPGGGGSSASGTANFNSIGLPLTFDFTTGNALSSITQAPPPQYTATFGTGGSFTMTGPYGLTFTGEVTGCGPDSCAFEIEKTAGVEVFYSGQWSDGVLSSGFASVYFVDAAIITPVPSNFVYFTGTVPVPVPEPSSYLLLETGVIGLGMLARRRRRGAC